MRHSKYSHPLKSISFKGMQLLLVFYREKLASNNSKVSQTEISNKISNLIKNINFYYKYLNSLLYFTITRAFLVLRSIQWLRFIVTISMHCHCKPSILTRSGMVTDTKRTF